MPSPAARITDTTAKLLVVISKSPSRRTSPVRRPREERSRIEASHGVDERTLVTFQSRFGAQEWLQPYTDETLARLGREGVKRVDVICPGFTADCLETLEEISMEGRHEFKAAGGGDFHYIPTTNDTPAWMTALTQIVGENLETPA